MTVNNNIDYPHIIQLYNKTNDGFCLFHPTNSDELCSIRCQVFSPIAKVFDILRSLATEITHSVSSKSPKPSMLSKSLNNLNTFELE